MRAWLEIDLGIVARNCDIVQQHIGSRSRILAVVKSDAYGHGLEAIVRTLETKVSGFAVIELEEALRVRKLSNRPTLILGYVADDQIAEAISQGFHLSLYDIELVHRFEEVAANLGLKANVHLKIETGLNRLGVQPEEAVSFLASLGQHPGLNLAGVYSHLAKSADPESNEVQMRRFREALAGSALPMHLANSHALAKFGDDFLDFVRVGLAMYGVEPVLPGLKPALTCKSVVIQRKRVRKGEGVSYNHLFRAPEDMDIAVIGIGYAEGLSQGLTGKARVLVCGKSTPIIGQICMNLCTIDARGLPVERGDEVVVVGEQGSEAIRIPELAAAAGLRHHEIITRFGLALPKIYR